MKKTASKAIFWSFLSALLLAVCFFLYAGNKILKPEKLGIVIKNQLEKKLEMPAHIDRVELRLMKGLHVELTGFRLGTPEKNLFIKADRIGVDLSPWRLLFGKISIQHITLLSPEITLPSPLGLDFGKSDKKTTVPPGISIQDGIIRTSFHNREILLDKIHGTLEDAVVNLTFEVESLENQVEIFASQVGNNWTGRIGLNGFKLERLMSQFKGLADILINFQLSENQISFSTEIKADTIHIPDAENPIEQASVEIRCIADSESMTVKHFKLNTSDFSLSGIGKLSGPYDLDKAENIFLNLSLTSDFFNFEKMVSHLPEKRLPDWLTPLIFRQIRDGEIRIREMKYNGSLTEFSDIELFGRKLTIDAELSNLSFGAGYGPERVTGITGSAGFVSGDLLFKNISGYTENAKLHCLDLIFPDVIAPDLRTIARVEVDMPVKDFVYLWRAGMEPREVYDILAPLSRVEGGHIKSNVVVQNNVTEGLAEIKGEVELDTCSFFWNEDQIETLSGRLTATDFSSKILINASGALNKFPVKEIAIDLEDPFGEARYHFSVNSETLPVIPRFKLLPEALFTIVGSGAGPLFKGTADLSTDGFTLFGTQYRSAGKKIIGSGEIAGHLWPEKQISFKEAKLKMPSGTLDLEYNGGDSKGNFNIKGMLNLIGSRTSGKTQNFPVRGGLDMALVWENRKPLIGHMQFKKFRTTQNKTPVLVNGPVIIAGELLSSPGIKISYGDVQTRLSGSLSTKNNALQFTGDIHVDRFKLENKPTKIQDSGLPDSLTANVYLTASNIEIFGTSFDKGESRLQIEKKVVSFNDLSIKGKSGNVKGSVTVFPNRENEMDLNLDLRNKGIKKLFQTMNPNKTIIDGYMRLTGHLYGTTKSINGNLEFTARDGYTYQSPLLSNIFAALNLYKIIKSKNIAIRKKQFTFNRISSNFKFTNSNISFDNFFLDSDSIQFSAVGSYSINEKQIDALVGVQPLETFDKAINAIPVLGWVLTGDGDEWLVICFKAYGDIEDPKIRLATDDTISKPMADTLLRIYKLPGRIIKKSRELIPKSKRG